MLALLLLTLVQARPGLVVLVGEGATIDAATCAEVRADRRLLLCAGDPAKVVDPLAAAGVPAGRIDLDVTRPFVGDDRETGERVRAAGCIVLAGGNYFDWFQLVTPGGTTTRLSDSIRAAHRDGIAVVGTGAAAPYLAKWVMVERSAVGKVERNPRRHREDVAIEGLGLLRDLLVDSSACQRGSPARLLRATFDGHLDRAIFLDGPTVWIGDPGRRTARVQGEGRTLFFDLASAQRNRTIWREGRLSLLGNGDAWTEHEGVACSKGGQTPELNAFLDRLRGSLESVPAKLTLRTDERTNAEGACQIAFDLEWEPSGS